MPDIFTAEAVHFRYDRKPVLGGVSFAIRPGELVCLLGPNGCGKTTLIKLMLGLRSPASGRLLLSGREVTRYTRRELAKQVASVPQHQPPAFAYTVLDVVLMGCSARSSFFGRPGHRDRDIALAALERFDITALADMPITRLSGGQRQRALLARALAQQAPVLVLDEPMTGLDFGHQARFLNILRDLCSEGHTCIMSTHFPDHALWVADHALMLRGGRIVADGAPETVVTHDSLGRLYDTSISVYPLSGTLRVCVPDDITGHARVSRQHAQPCNAKQ